MKPIHALLLAMAGLLLLINSPLRAQEQPRPPQPPEPPRVEEPERPSRPRPSEEKAVAFMGVLTRSVPQELRAQFSLPDGFGLMVDEVMPDSPAQAAGLKVHDVLVKFDDQHLVNMEQLLTLVRSKKKGDTVAFTVLTGGKENVVNVVISERMMPAQSRSSFGPMSRGGSFFGNPDWDRRGPDMNQEWRESAERMQDQMREYQERVQKWSADGGRGNFPPPPIFRGSDSRDGDRRGDKGSRHEERGPRGPRDGEQRMELEHREVRETASVTRSDESGIYSLRREGDKTLFTAKPKEGQEQSWNLDNETERQSIPEPMREKLKMLEEIRGQDRHESGAGGDRRGAPEAPQREKGL